MAENANLMIYRTRAAAQWFITIALLSMLNTLLSFGHAGFVLIVGLGISQIIDGIARGLGAAGMTIGFILNAAAAAVFLGLGAMAKKYHAWAFIAGMALYLLDTLILLAVGIAFHIPPDAYLLSVAFHVYVLYRIFPGVQAAQKMKGLAFLNAAQPSAGAVQPPSAQ